MENKYKLYRCFFTDVRKAYIIGKDINGKKYYIVKNSASKNYKKGTDDYFYATLETKGYVLKKSILTPIKYEEYLKLIKNKG